MDIQKKIPVPYAVLPAVPTSLMTGSQKLKKVQLAHRQILRLDGE